MNDNPGHIAEFEKLLTHNLKIPPNKVKFYVYWVNKFLEYRKHRSFSSLDQIMASYLNAIEQDSHFSDWQVKQAAETTSGQSKNSWAIKV